MTVEICVLRCWRFLNHLDIVRRHLIAAIQLAVSCSELYFVRCCALKRTGKYAPDSKVMCLFLTDFKTRCFDVSFPTSISVNNYFEIEN